LKRKYILLTLAVLIAAVIAFVVYRNRQSTLNGDIPTIKIAANFPLSGELAFYGDAFRDGLIMAVDERGSAINNNARISFDWGDNQFTPREAINVYQNQQLGQPTIYTSALKPQVMAVTDEVSRAGLPHFAWILDVDVNPAGTRNNLRCWVSFKLEADVFLKHAASRDVKRVAVVYLSLPSSEVEYGKIIVPELKKQGREVLVEPFTSSVQPEDFKTITAKVAAFKPDLVMINGFIPQMVSIIRGLRSLSVIKDGNTLASLDMLDASNALSPQEAEGVVVAAPQFLLNPTAEQTAWSERFRQRFGRQPPYHSAFAYDTGLVILDAAQRLNQPATSEAWISALRDTKIQGLTGELRFDSDGSLVTELAPAIYRNGKLTPLR
jgi:branched-chain amino acid transport system substrate-binding protein